MIPAYPLTWPAGWPRTPTHERKDAAFTTGKRSYMPGGGGVTRVSVAAGLERALTELRRLGVTREDVVVSTNVRTRIDGYPRSDQPEPADPGVAIYWEQYNGARRVIAIDIYSRVGDNLAAIAATLDALRAIERHGGARILERAFTGFTALPAPGQTSAPGWRELLGFHGDRQPTRAVLDAAYREARKRAHPDHGGTSEQFHAVQLAYEQACQEIRA